MFTKYFVFVASCSSLLLTKVCQQMRVYVIGSVLVTLVEKGQFVSPHLCRMKDKTTQNIICIAFYENCDTKHYCISTRLELYAQYSYYCATHITHVCRTLRSIRRTSLHSGDKIEALSASHLTNVRCKRLICVGPLGPTDADQLKRATHFFKPQCLLNSFSYPNPQTLKALRHSNPLSLRLSLTLKPSFSLSLKLSPSLSLLLLLLTATPLPISVRLRRTTNNERRNYWLLRVSLATSSQNTYIPPPWMNSSSFRRSEERLEVKSFLIRTIFSLLHFDFFHCCELSVRMVVDGLSARQRKNLRDLGSFLAGGIYFCFKFSCRRPRRRQAAEDEDEAFCFY